MNYRRITLYFTFLLGLIFFSACESVTSDTSSPETTASEEKDAPKDMSFEAMKHYYHAYLAYCVDAEVVRDKKKGPTAAVEHFLGLANDRIAYAIKNIDTFGIDSLVWGPALIVDNQGDGLYTPENVMYCLKKVNSDEYYIGIAGTNMLSPFDWFTEDLLVDQQEEWLAGGKIAKGSMIAFNKINSLMDTKTGYTLVEFLEEKVTQNPNVTISVAGHSLGGALTQVYSSYLTYRFKDPATEIQAWPYAGPSAGDTAFASILIDSLDAYHAYNNSLDMVPHAWQADSLQVLCGLYNGLNICDKTLEENVPFNGVVRYLIDISKAGEYKIPGTPFEFHGAPITVDGKGCQSIKKNMDRAWNYHTDVRKYINEIAKKCSGGQKIKWPEFEQFFYHGAEMAGQHTIAYFDYFFGGSGAKEKALRAALDSAVPNGKGNIAEDIETLDIMEHFLKKVKDHNFSNGCACND